MVNIALRAARRAGEIIVRAAERMDRVRIDEKGRNDFVTEIDQAAEREIVHHLKRAYPTHSFLGEEFGLVEGSDPDYRWIIDPLDGTTNFMHGYPHFAVSIACQIDGRIEHGVIYDPMRQELFTGSRGSGAFLENRRLRVSSRRSLDGALIGTGFPYRDNLHLLDTYLAMFKAVTQRAAGLRHPGAAALDLAYVAAGRVDGFWEFGLRAWDTAAGTLLVREAGGLIATLDGAEYKQGGNIVAGTPRVFNELLETIAPHLANELREATR